MCVSSGATRGLEAVVWAGPLVLGARVHLFFFECGERKPVYIAGMYDMTWGYAVTEHVSIRPAIEPIHTSDRSQCRSSTS